MKVTSTEFRRNVGRYQQAAFQAPVEITKHGRPHTVLISSVLFEIITKGRAVRRVQDLDDETMKAIAASEVSVDYAALDELLSDLSPS